MDRADFGVGVGGEKSEQLMLALYGIRLGAALAVPCRPDTGKHRERPILIEREPGLLLAATFAGGS